MILVCRITRRLLTAQFARSHIHDRKHRKRDTIKCFNQREITRKRDRLTGLDTLKYAVVSQRNVTIDGARAVVVNVQLECDKTVTPWCECEASTNSL